ncbi:MAG TPA: vWA domain-containing protein [Gaiellaceae bacterium]|nr:vWA domain-containing protein [Gaiellaceae bacterium]
MGFSFLTPLDSLFVLAAAVPLAAVLFAHRRATAVRRLFSLPPQRSRGLTAAIVALALVPALVGVAAAQPVIIRQQAVSQRADAEAFFVFDTSLSMTARTARNAPSRIARSKREAVELASQLGDIPVGIASMTDRTLPVLMPTTDLALFERAVQQSIAVNRPPPSQLYKDRATTFTALTGMTDEQFFPPTVTHPILVVFTDGESSALPVDITYEVSRDAHIHPLLVHVWRSGEHVFERDGVDQRYVEDPGSSASLDAFAKLMHGRVFHEGDVGGLAGAIHAAAGGARSHTSITEYARVALAPWFVLGCVAPLAFLIWRRNL